MVFTYLYLKIRVFIHISHSESLSLATVNCLYLALYKSKLVFARVVLRLEMTRHPRPRTDYVSITIYDDMNRLLSINQKKMEISSLLEKGILEIILKIHLLTFRQLYFSKFLSNVHSINSSVQTYITCLFFVYSC